MKIIGYYIVSRLRAGVDRWLVEFRENGRPIMVADKKDAHAFTREDAEAFVVRLLEMNITAALVPAVEETNTPPLLTSDGAP